MHKQGECEAFFVSSPFISEGMTRFITSLVQAIVANAVLLLAELCKLAVYSKEQQAYISLLCPPSKKKKGREDFFWYLNELQINDKSQAIN